MDGRRNSVDQGKSGGWAQTGKLRTGNPNQTVAFGANFPHAHYYTLQFAVVRPNTPVASQNQVAVEALIVWSVAGNQVKRRVSVGNGTSISGPGEAVSVTIYDKTQNNGQTMGVEYDVTVQLTPGSRPSTTQPPTLTPDMFLPSVLPIIPGGALVNIPIPLDAGAISFEIEATSTDETSLQFLTIEQRVAGSATTFKSISYPFAGGRFIALAPQADHLDIFLDAAAPANVNVAIAFGIDG